MAGAARQRPDHRFAQVAFIRVTWLVQLCLLVALLTTTPGYSTIVESEDDPFWDSLTTEDMLLETQRPKQKTKPKSAPARPPAAAQPPGSPQPQPAQTPPQATKPMYTTEQIHILRKAHAQPFYINILWIFDREYQKVNSQFAPFKLMNYIITELGQRKHNIKLKMTLVSNGLSQKQQAKLTTINELFQAKFGKDRTVHNVTYGKISKYITLDGGMNYLTKSIGEDDKTGFEQLFEHSSAYTNKLQKNIVVFITKEEAKYYKPKRGLWWSPLRMIVAGAFGALTGGLGFAIAAGAAGASMGYSSSTSRSSKIQELSERTWQLGDSKHDKRSPAKVAAGALKLLFKNQPYEVWSIVGGAPIKSYNDKKYFKVPDRNPNAAGDKWQLKAEGGDKFKLVRSDLTPEEQSDHHSYSYKIPTNTNDVRYQELPRTMFNELRYQLEKFAFKHVLCLNESTCKDYGAEKIMNEDAGCDDRHDRETANRYANYRGPGGLIRRNGKLTSRPQLFQYLCVVNHPEKKQRILPGILTRQTEITLQESSDVSSDSAGDHEYHVVDWIKVGDHTLFDTKNSNNLFYDRKSYHEQENLINDGAGLCKHKVNGQVKLLQPAKFVSRFQLDGKYANYHPQPECIKLTYEPSKSSDCKKRTGRKYIELAKQTRGLSMTPCAAQSLGPDAKKKIGKHLTSINVLNWATSSSIELSKKADEIKQITVTADGETSDPLPAVTTYLNTALRILKADPDNDLPDNCPQFISYSGSRTRIRLWFDLSTYYKQAMTMDDKGEFIGPLNTIDEAAKCYDEYKEGLKALLAQYGTDDDDKSTPECKLEAAAAKCRLNIQYKIATREN